jgi:hypothetical protein
MKLSIAACALLAALATPVSAQGTEQLGKVSFPTSCSPAVQQEFERGVAMLHSYWFSYARKTFESVLQKDPECAMAYWGIALDALGNSLVGPPSREVATRAAEAIEKARTTGSKTPREPGSRRSAPTTRTTTRCGSTSASPPTTARWSS